MLIVVHSGRLSLEGGLLLASVRLDGSRRGDVVKVTHGAKETDILGALRSRAGEVEEVVREAKVEIVTLLNVGNILGSQLQAECLDIGLEMSDLTATDNGEQIRSLYISNQLAEGLRRWEFPIYLLQRVGKCDGSHRDIAALGDLVQDSGDLLFAAEHHVWGVAASLLGLLLGGLEVACVVLSARRIGVG